MENSLNSRTGRGTYALFTVALVCFFNPCVNIIDIFPDFIGCIILYAALRKASFAAPYFTEAREWLLRLAAVSALKLPALVAVVMIRSKNTLDNDVVALAALVFAVLEIICFIPAIGNLFSALFYLGERTDASALIKSERGASPESLKSFTVMFFIMKSVLSAAPELLRLTRAVELGDTTVVARGSWMYPYAVLISAVCVLLIGAIWLTKAIRYLYSVLREGKFASAIDTLCDASAGAEYERTMQAARRGRIKLFTILACAMTIELTFKNLGDVNILPHTVGGIFLLLTLFELISLCKPSRAIKITAYVGSGLFLFLSALCYGITAVFLEEHTYSDLVEGGSAAARRAYSAVTISGAFELAAYLLTVAILALLLIKYIDKSIIKTGGEALSRVDLDRRKSLVIKTLALCSMLSLIGLGRFIQIILRGYQTAISTGGSPQHSSIIISQSLPWFGVVLTLLTVVCTIFAVYYFGILADEEKI